MRRTVAAWAGLACGLAGCASTSRAGSLPARPSPPASASASASASAPAEPAAGPAAVAAVRGYYAELNRALASGDTSVLATLSEPACSCRPVLGYITRAWSAGALRGARYDLRSLAADSVRADAADVLVGYAVTAYTEVDAGGRVRARVAAVPGARARVTVVRRAGRWLVADVVRLP